MDHGDLAAHGEQLPRIVHLLQRDLQPADIPASLAAFPLNLNIADGGANGTGGFTSLGFSQARFRKDAASANCRLVDDLSYIVGKHSLKFGINYRYNRVTDTGNQKLTQGGQYNLVDLSEFAQGAYTSARAAISANASAPSRSRITACITSASTRKTNGP